MRTPMMLVLALLLSSGSLAAQGDSLREALVSLQNDRAFLTRGDVFSDDQIDSYIELKWDEVMRWETTPSPVEFVMYYSS